MEGIYSAYKIINENTLAVLKDLNPVKEVEIPKEPAYVSMKENLFELTEETKRLTKVVVAHNLSQYKNKFGSIRLSDNCKVYMDLSIAIKKENDVLHNL